MEPDLGVGQAGAERGVATKSAQRECREQYGGRPEQWVSTRLPMQASSGLNSVSSICTSPVNLAR